MKVVIIHRLVLAIRCSDTTTGGDIIDNNIMLRQDGKTIIPQRKADGMLVLQDRAEHGVERTNFQLTIEAKGFVTAEVEVDYAQLDAKTPLLEVQLIPNEKYISRWPLLAIEGTLPGLSALDCVRAGETTCLMREYDPRRRLITIFNPHNLELNRNNYGLVNPDTGSYEQFSIVKRISSQVYKIKGTLDLPFKNYYPICPIVLGQVGENGRYCLRVQDDSSAARWIVRYNLQGTNSFETVEFREQKN